VYDSDGVISVISAHRSQKGPKGNRLILGPFRFANHDCSPNCQVCLPTLMTLMTWRAHSL
jgi:hypothetical protein